jgi:phosphoesterase RecJ-like protein
MIAAADHELFRTLVGGARRFVLTTHINPDGDALGSEIGLSRFLREAGREVRIVNHDPTPDNLDFLAFGDTPVEVYAAATHDAVVEAADLVVLVDNSAPDRLGGMERVARAAAGRTLCIDHHPSRGMPWAHAILDERSSATAALIFELTRARGFRLDAAAAEAIFVGLATDTGFFRFNSTTARAHEIAAELIAAGVDSAAVYRRIYERNSPAFARLLGHALAGLELSAGGAVASVTLRHALISELGALDVDSSEIATNMLAIDGLVVALLFRELPDARIKVSLRSKGDFDVHELAGEFGGGGHRNASGIVLAGALEAVVARVVERTQARLSRRGM